MANLPGWMRRSFSSQSTVAQSRDAQLDSVIRYAVSYLSQDVSRQDISKSLENAGYPYQKVRYILDRAAEALRRGQGKGSSSLIELKTVNKCFGTNTVLNNVSLSVPAGEVTGLIGLSGSGKTTLLNMLVGLLYPDSGDVVFHRPGAAACSIQSLQREVTKLVGFAPQEPSFYRRLTVKENLEHFASLYKMSEKEKQERISSLLDLVDLHDAKDTLGRDLSGGMQRRFGIACALIHNPSILIMDEATSDLDPVMRKDIWHLIRNVNAQGRTVLLTSHFFDEIEGLCDRVAVLHNGCIAAHGTPDELRSSHSSDYEIELETASRDYSSVINMLQNSGFPISTVNTSGTRLKVLSPYAGEITNWITTYIRKSGDELLNFRYDRPGLDAVFESLINRQSQ